MRLVSLLTPMLVAGCAKSAAPPPEVPSNAAAATEGPANDTVTSEPLPLGPAGTCAVGGQVVDARTDEPIAGATIVLTRGDDGEPTITDEHGRFLVHAVHVPEKLNVYYADLHLPLEAGTMVCGHALRIKLDTAAAVPK